MDDLEGFMKPITPTAARPLLGRTILVVEDSRFACEAMRLLCLRSGARLRRADCLASARKHLQLYRPDVLIVDLGLPDGSGSDLIAELAATSPRIEVILAMSGDIDRKDEALQAGAVDFLAKPIESLAAFQRLVLAHLPEAPAPPCLASPAPRLPANDRIRPDPIAYQDDIAHACDVLESDPDGRNLDYLAQFTAGLARSARDADLMAAAQALRRNGRPGRADLVRLAGVLQRRLGRRVTV